MEKLKSINTDLTKEAIKVNEDKLNIRVYFFFIIILMSKYSHCNKDQLMLNKYFIFYLKGAIWTCK